MRKCTVKTRITVAFWITFCAGLNAGLISLTATAHILQHLSCFQSSLQQTSPQVHCLCMKTDEINTKCDPPFESACRVPRRHKPAQMQVNQKFIELLSEPLACCCSAKAGSNISNIDDSKATSTENYTGLLLWVREPLQRGTVPSWQVWKACLRACLEFLCFSWVLVNSQLSSARVQL